MHLGQRRDEADDQYCLEQRSEQHTSAASNQC